jgi:hypothetical protein
MSDDPIGDVYSFVERAYIRLQAGDILIRCLEDGSTSPIQQMVEGLILAGPQSLDDLQQVLIETTTRKAQVEDDLQQVYVEMKRVLREYGVEFTPAGDYHAALMFSPLELIVLMRSQGVEDHEKQSACQRVFQDSYNLLKNLSTNFHLLTEIERYLQDWSLGLTYQKARQRSNVESSELNNLQIVFKHRQLLQRC